MLKCIIIDDEITAITIIEKICKPLQELEVVATFQNALEALKYLKQHTIDLIFLDLKTPILSGFETLKSINQKTAIIITSSSRKIISEATEFKLVTDFIVKPLKSSKVLPAISQIIKSKKEEELKAEKTKNNEIDALFVDATKLFVTINNKYVALNAEDISYLHIQETKLLIITKLKTYKTDVSLEAVISRIKGIKLIRIHKFYMVNIDAIVDVKYGNILLEKEVLPLGNSYKKALRSQLNLLQD